MGAEQSVQRPPTVIHQHHYHPPQRNEVYVHTPSVTVKKEYTIIAPSQSTTVERIRSSSTSYNVQTLSLSRPEPRIMEIRDTPSITINHYTAASRTYDRTSIRPSARITEIKDKPNRNYQKSITSKPSVPAIKAKTNKASNNNEKRGFGEYKCSTCNRTWKSGCSWADAGQKCNKCNTNVRPHKLTQLNRHQQDKCEKCKKLGRPCYSN